MLLLFGGGRGMIIDYESKYTFPLTNDSLRQIWGVNTTFVGISCGYGIFPPNYIWNSIDNISVEDWGINKYNKYNIKGSSIRKYFRWWVSQWKHYFLFLHASTAFNVFGTDNAGELDTYGFQYPLLSVSILHSPFCGKNFWHKWYSFALLNARDNGKLQNWQAIFTRVNITYNFSKVRVGLPGVCLSKAMISSSLGKKSVASSNMSCRWQR